MASATSFKDILGIKPSTASTGDSTLIIIDAQNEYSDGKLKVQNVDSSRKAIAGLLEKYRQAKGNIVHVLHETPEGAPVFSSENFKEFEELKP